MHSSKPLQNVTVVYDTEMCLRTYCCIYSTEMCLRFLHFVALIFTGVSPQKEEGGSQNGFCGRQKTPVLPKETWSQQHLWH